MSGPSPLDGMRVLVTRPAHQADGLCASIERSGGIALRMPALEIGTPVNPGAVRVLAPRLDRYDLAVFVSPNAVHGALALLGRALPPRLQVAAIGPATAAALDAAGVTDVICPDHGFDSESLLEMRVLREVAGMRIVVFRGDGGRGLLGETLRARGADVEYVEVYRRTLPPPPGAGVADALRRRTVDAVVVTSLQGLENLVAMCGDELMRGLFAAQLVVPSARMIEKAEAMGFGTPLVAGEAGDHAIVEALVAWRTGRPPEEIGSQDE